MPRFVFYTPNNIKELQQCLYVSDESTYYLAGGTDLVIKLRKSDSKEKKIIDLSGIKELNNIVLDKDVIKIGACTPFSKIADSLIIQKHARCLSLAASELGSIQIRNRATIGGNIANASPAADSMAPLSVLGAKALLMDKKGEKTVVDIENLIAGVGNNNLTMGQVILEIFFPVNKSRVTGFVKLGSRKKVSISRLNIALSAGYCNHSRMLENVRVAIGAAGFLPLNAVKSASLIKKVSMTKEVTEEFSESLAKELEKAIDGRSSMPYKRQAVKGLGMSLLHNVSLYISELEKEDTYD